MVWTSPRQARHKSIAANVEYWVTTTKGVLRMQFTVMQTLVLLEIQQMEHLLRSEHHCRELLVEGTQCRDLSHCKFILSTRCCCLVAQSKIYKVLIVECVSIRMFTFVLIVQPYLNVLMQVWARC